ncbi:MAG: pyridoxamine 5-phosphate oxidase-related FMN-binding [Clostridia bacterium]|nr:pyridoxamine 5-phosphate oxidase-related FMN-binding [Clostridia bacterium]
MTAEQIFELISKHPAFYMATIERNEPRVRGMLLYKADQEGIVFHTGTMKEVYRQVLENPRNADSYKRRTAGCRGRISKR